MKCCSVFADVISRVSLCSWFCIYFVDYCFCIVGFGLNTVLHYVRCKCLINALLHYVMLHYSQSLFFCFMV